MTDTIGGGADLLYLCLCQRLWSTNLKNGGGSWDREESAPKRLSANGCL